MASGSCSTTTTVLPRSASRRRIAEQPPRVRGVQADRRLVEDVEGPGQRAAERRGEADALRLAARERARRARERQIVEPDLVHVAHARTDLRDDRRQALLLGVGERQVRRTSARRSDERQLAELGDRRPAEAHGQRRPARAAPRGTPGRACRRGSAPAGRGRGSCSAWSRASRRSRGLRRSRRALRSGPRARAPRAARSGCPCAPSSGGRRGRDRRRPTRTPACSTARRAGPRGSGPGPG